MMNRAQLPNVEGYKFRGVFKDGSYSDCVVIVRDGAHTVENFGQLVGWFPFPGVINRTAIARGR